MNDDRLHRIQTLQFSDKAAAEALLLSFAREVFSHQVTSIELRPLAVSLNSFNGFLTLDDGRRLFFKTHTEPDGVIGEYYQASVLAQAGYPIVQPVFSSTQAGKQFLVYEVIDDPSVFDTAWAIENGQSAELSALTTAQQAADEALWNIYQETLAWQMADEAARAPVHQLFHHRLAGGRLTRFYDPANPIELPCGKIALGMVRRVRWQINGQIYAETLDELITRASWLLNPKTDGPAIIGHGDAHNGNVFYRAAEASLIYFDPAFAGRHHPLLDLTKPLFHNVFAMWMYFPREKQSATAISLTTYGDEWHIAYTYDLHPVRLMFLKSKIDRVLVPLLIELKRRGWLLPGWRDYLKAALFCCPFLTMNLADSTRFPPAISLLGLAMAVEMGAWSQGERSMIDRILDEAAYLAG